jgi:hypothetical protein
MRWISVAVRFYFVRSADGEFGGRRTQISGAVSPVYYHTETFNFLFKEIAMTIKVGDKMPAGKLWELPVEWFAGCPTAADEITLPDAFKGKRIVLFGLPGAYTRT